MEVVDALAQVPLLLYGATLALGLIVGSFLNVVILRLPRMMEQEWRQECAELAGSEADAGTPTERLSLSTPSSHCPSCGHRIRPWENIPVLSYLLLRGRCSQCAQAISWRYPLVELLTALLSVMVLWQFGPTLQGGFALLLTWGLIALAFIDADTQLLPDDITLPLLWIGLLLSVWGIFADSHSAIIGAVTGYMSLWLIFHLFRLLTGKEGMGRGDFKLLALFGAWLGWQTLPQILLLSTIPGALFGIMMVAVGRGERQTPISFGPFLAIAGWISLVWGSSITDAYLRWSGLA
jgi:leader peptidase (prepilin peptidase)/N-methyltransferase